MLVQFSTRAHPHTSILLLQKRYQTLLVSRLLEISLANSWGHKTAKTRTRSSGESDYETTRAGPHFFLLQRDYQESRSFICIDGSMQEGNGKGVHHWRPFCGMELRHSRHLRDPRCHIMGQNQEISMKKACKWWDDQLAKIARNGKPNRPTGQPPKLRKLDVDIRGKQAHWMKQKTWS